MGFLKPCTCAQRRAQPRLCKPTSEALSFAGTVLNFQHMWNSALPTGCRSCEQCPIYTNVCYVVWCLGKRGDDAAHKQHLNLASCLNPSTAGVLFHAHLALESVLSLGVNLRELRNFGLQSGQIQIHQVSARTEGDQLSNFAAFCLCQTLCINVCCCFSIDMIQVWWFQALLRRVACIFPLLGKGSQRDQGNEGTVDSKVLLSDWIAGALHVQTEHNLS